MKFSYSRANLHLFRTVNNNRVDLKDSADLQRFILNGRVFHSFGKKVRSPYVLRWQWGCTSSSLSDELFPLGTSLSLGEPKYKPFFWHTCFRDKITLICAYSVLLTDFSQVASRSFLLLFSFSSIVVNFNILSVHVVLLGIFW